MADIKVLYVNSNGFNQEHSEAADSVKFLSFKTANKELTDAKLSNLIDGADANDEHIHDARYFRENEFISSSAGVGDAGKPVKTDSNGKIDNSLVNVSGLNALLDHGALQGLADDDHLQYLKTDGTRDISGVIKYSSHPTFTQDTQLVDKKFVTDLVTGKEWQDSVLSRSITPPGSPVLGDRYLIDGSLGTATGAWAGKENNIAEWNGSAWIFTAPTIGTNVSVDSESDGIYLYSGSAWDKKFYESTTASNGLQKVGVDIQVNPTIAGQALAFASGVLDVQTDSIGIEVVSDKLQLKDLGVKSAKIDFGLGAAQVKAALIPIADAGNYTSQTQVEGALQELYEKVQNQGVDYTTAVGGVTKGFPVYLSANDTVTEYGALTGTQRVIGLAAATQTAGAPVRVLSNDTVIQGILTGFTAGQTVYWNGSGFVSAIPSGAGSHVWKLGVAKNATDLHVEVEFIKRNA